MAKIQYNTGDKVGYSTFLNYVPIPKNIVNQSNKWGLFLCGFCGAEFTNNISKAKHRDKSCGCQSSRNTIGERAFKHGMKTREITNPVYKCWTHIKDRCHNEKCKAYKDYGGRGIRVCDEWVHSFDQFYADMGDRPTL